MDHEPELESDREHKDRDKPKKLAVVLIHGMGDQTPMETLRSFVDAVWTNDPKVTGGRTETWTKPDYRLGSRELKRITTQADTTGTRTDFFEFYWAHMMQATQLSSVVWWLRYLFLRPLKRVPTGVRHRWFTGWFALIVLIEAVVALIWSALALIAPEVLASWQWWTPLVPLGALVLLAIYPGKSAATPAFVALVGAAIWGIGWLLSALFEAPSWPAWSYVLGAPLAAFALTSLYLVIISGRLVAAKWIWFGLGASVGALIGIAVTAPNNPDWASHVPIIAAPLLALTLWFLRHRLLVEMIGDAARYLTPSPGNIGARREIRESGLELINELHDSGEYDRVVVVGHSLGSVIGYDILSFYWADVVKDLQHASAKEAGALRDIEDAATALRHELDKVGRSGGGLPLKAVLRFQRAQRAYACVLGRAHPKSWLVTDFVTVGSPLTHAHFLLADDAGPVFEKELERASGSWIGKHLGLGSPPREQSVFARVAKVFAVRASQREFPVCPPQTEKVHEGPCRPEARESGDSFSYELSEGVCVPHHAALFAAVRWTNLHIRNSGALFGDPIGGPVAPLFGPGVLDVELCGALAERIYAHSAYWDEAKAKDQIEWLRRAIDLRDRHKHASARQAAIG